MMPSFLIVKLRFIIQHENMRNIDRFIGREKELKILKDSIKNREKGVCIYGP